LKVWAAWGALCLIALLACLGAMASAAPNATPPVPTYSLRTFNGPPGSTTAILDVNDNGDAVGFRRLADGSRYGIFWNGSRMIDARPLLGRASEIQALNDHDDMVGWRAASKTTTTADVLDGTGDPSAMPHAFFLSRAGLRILPYPSFATGVNLNDVVVGDFRAPNGTIHGFAWLNGMSFVDLGQGDVYEVNDRNVIVGGIGQYAGYWMPSGHHQWKWWNAGFDGRLTAINDRFALGAARDSQTGGSYPVAEFKLRTPLRLQFTPFRKRVIFDWGNPGNGPVIGGAQVDPAGAAQPVLYMVLPQGSSIEEVDFETYVSESPKVKIGEVSATNTAGFIAGSALVDRTFSGFLLTPDVREKINDARNALLYTPGEGERHGKQLDYLAQAAQMLRSGNRSQACDLLTQVRRDFSVEANDEATDPDLADFYDENVDTVLEAQDELRCPGLPGLPLAPSFEPMPVVPSVVISSATLMTGSTPDEFDYNYIVNQPINAFEIGAPTGAGITPGTAPSGFSCSVSGAPSSGEKLLCTGGSIAAGASSSGSFGVTAAQSPSPTLFELSVSTNHGASWQGTTHFTEAPPTPPVTSPPPVTTPVVIVSNKDAFLNNISPCQTGATLELSWTVDGAPSGAPVVVQMSGPDLPAQPQTFMIGADGTFGQDYSISGSGTWTTDVLTINGQPAPTDNAHNSATATCAGAS